MAQRHQLTDRAALFALPGHRGFDLRHAPIIAIDVETTGLSIDGDRIVELAIVRVSASGEVQDEWTSLMNPGGDVGPTFIHHVTNEMVADAPTFRDLVGDILPRLEGGIIVSHYATFEEGFLAAELSHIGIRLPSLPALCTLELTQDLHDPPNLRLETCCRTVGGSQEDTGGALGDARMKAALAALLLSAPTLDLRWPTTPPDLPRYQTLANPRTRVTELRKGERGWMAGVIAKLPITTGHAEPIEAEAYLGMLGDVVADGKITGDEAKVLARQAGRAGLGAAELDELHRRFLSGLEIAALDDGVLSATELQQLQRVAQLLNQPNVFAHLAPDAPVDIRITRPSPRPRVWCSPSITTEIRDRIELLGVTVASNLTRKVAVVVVHPADQADERVDRGRFWQLPIINVSSLVELRPSQATPAVLPVPTGRSHPPPWTQSRRAVPFVSP